MIKLNIGIFDGSCETVYFDRRQDLFIYIDTLKEFDCIWLVTTSNIKTEIIVTESVELISTLILLEHVQIKETTLFIQEYQTYEEAYAVALDMIKEKNENN